MPAYRRILLTGAAGALGSVLRRPLLAWCTNLRVTDRRGLGETGPAEEVLTGNLADPGLADELTRDVDCVVHMSGVVGARTPFAAVLESNIVALRNLYESSRRNRVRRIIWASSNHAVGFYPWTQRVDAAAMPRPDSPYGISKVFGEALAQYHWDRFGLESVSLRIGSCFPRPRDLRMLATWLSYPDLVRLVECCLRAPRVGHTIAYGVSDNASQLWDNRLAAHLGFKPQDSAEDYRADIEATGAAIDPADPASAVHGGAYAAAEPGPD